MDSTDAYMATISDETAIATSKQIFVRISPKPQLISYSQNDEPIQLITKTEPSLNGRKYYCNLCEKDIKSSHGPHVWKHLDLPLYKCSECDFSANVYAQGKFLVERHVTKCHSSATVLPLINTYAKEYNKQWNECYGFVKRGKAAKRKVMRCKLCHKQLNKNGQLTLHIWQCHMTEAPYKCSRCSFAAKLHNKRAIDIHVKQHTSVAKIVDKRDELNEKFNTLKDLCFGVETNGQKTRVDHRIRNIFDVLDWQTDESTEEMECDTVVESKDNVKPTKTIEKQEPVMLDKIAIIDDDITKTMKGKVAKPENIKMKNEQEQPMERIEKNKLAETDDLETGTEHKLDTQMTLTHKGNIIMKDIDEEEIHVNVQPQEINEIEKHTGNETHELQLTVKGKISETSEARKSIEQEVNKEHEENRLSVVEEQIETVDENAESKDGKNTMVNANQILEEDNLDNLEQSRLIIDEGQPEHENENLESEETEAEGQVLVEEKQPEETDYVDQMQLIIDEEWSKAIIDVREFETMEKTKELHQDVEQNQLLDNDKQQTEPLEEINERQEIDHDKNQEKIHVTNEPLQERDVKEKETANAERQANQDNHSKFAEVMQQIPTEQDKTNVIQSTKLSEAKGIFETTNAKQLDNQDNRSKFAEVTQQIPTEQDKTDVIQSTKQSEAMEIKETRNAERPENEDNRLKFAEVMQQIPTEQDKTDVIQSTKLSEAKGIKETTNAKQLQNQDNRSKFAEVTQQIPTEQDKADVIQCTKQSEAMEIKETRNAEQLENEDNRLKFADVTQQIPTEQDKTAVIQCTKQSEAMEMKETTNVKQLGNEDNRSKFVDVTQQIPTEQDKTDVIQNIKQSKAMEIEQTSNVKQLVNKVIQSAFINEAEQLHMKAAEKEAKQTINEPEVILVEQHINKVSRHVQLEEQVAQNVKHSVQQRTKMKDQTVNNEKQLEQARMHKIIIENKVDKIGEAISSVLQQSKDYQSQPKVKNTNISKKAMECAVKDRPRNAYEMQAQFIKRSYSEDCQQPLLGNNIVKIKNPVIPQKPTHHSPIMASERLSHIVHNLHERLQPQQKSVKDDDHNDRKRKSDAPPYNNEKRLRSSEDHRPFKLLLKAALGKDYDQGTTANIPSLNSPNYSRSISESPCTTKMSTKGPELSNLNPSQLVPVIQWARGQGEPGAKKSWREIQTALNMARPTVIMSTKDAKVTTVEAQPKDLSKSEKQKLKLEKKKKIEEMTYDPKTERKPILCKLCGDIILRKSVHVYQWHMNQPVYQCPLCNFHCTYVRSATTRHIINKHKEEFEQNPNLKPIDCRGQFIDEFIEVYSKCFEDKPRFLLLGGRNKIMIRQSFLESS